MMQSVSSNSKIASETKNGIAFYNKREYKKAAACFKRVVEYWKENTAEKSQENLASALYNLGSSELELGEFKQAVADLKEASSLEKDNQKYARRYKKACLYLSFSRASVERGVSSGEKIAE